MEKFKSARAKSGRAGRAAEARNWGANRLAAAERLDLVRVMPRNRNRRRGGGGRGGGSDGDKASPDKPLFGGGVPAAARPVNITIYTRRGESEQMQCALYETVRALRDAARQRLGGDLDRLVFGGSELEDGRTLTSYGIQEGSTVSEPFQVTVQLPSLALPPTEGKYDVTVSGSGSHTVDSLKRAVERTAAYRNSFEDFEIDDIFEDGLVFEGVQLKGDKLLCEYKIKEGSVVVAGGGRGETSGAGDAYQ